MKLLKIIGLMLVPGWLMAGGFNGTSAGVSSINLSGNSGISGPATISCGSNMSCSQTSSTITLTSTGGGGTPSGPNYGVQVDSNTSLGGSSNFTSDGTSVTINVPLTVNSNMNINSTNEDIQYIPGPGTGGTSYLWAQGNSSFSPSKFSIVYSALNNGTTIAALLFSNSGNTFQFQNGNGNTNASIGTGGNISATSILVTYGVLVGSATIGQMQVTSNTILSGTTFYQNGPWAVSGNSIGASGNVLQSGGVGQVPNWGSLNLTNSNSVGGILPSGNLPTDVVYNDNAPSATFASSVTVNAALGVDVVYGVTAGSVTTTSAGAGQLQAAEGSAPPGISAVDILYGNLTTHTLHHIDNNGSDGGVPFYISGTSATLESTTVGIGWLGFCTNCGTDAMGVSTSTLNGFVEMGSHTTQIK